MRTRCVASLLVALAGVSLASACSSSTSTSTSSTSGATAGTSAPASASAASTSGSGDAASNAPAISIPTNTAAAGKTIELINGNDVDPYFFTVKDGAQAAADTAGAKLVVQAPNSFDPTQQVPLMASAIANKVSAIILSADGYQQLLPSLLQAHAAGIPVILINESEGDMDNTPYALSFITSDNTDLGKAAGLEMSQLVPSGSTVSVINSVTGLQSELERGSGFVDGLQAAGAGVTALPQQFDDDDPTKAQSIATDLLQAHPNLAGIYAVDSFTGQGVGTAIRALNKSASVKVVALDAEPQEVQLLQEGVIQALIAQKPYYVGQLAVEYAVDAITGKTSDIVRSVNPGSVTVTKSNFNSPESQQAIYRSK
jgi:ribose transport system substrate-binding protein